jgi:nucleotide-binding universal stress UspA family protein
MARLWKGASMRRVLIPTDFSEATLHVTREAVSWVTAMGGELLLLHVVPDLCLRWLDGRALSFIDRARLEAAYEELREEGLERFSRWLPYPPEGCRRLVVVGHTAEAIIRVAQVEGVDLIIMRARTRKWWWPALPGSVTNTVMHRASVPVMVWAGVDRMASDGWWRGTSSRHEWDTASLSH